MASKVLNLLNFSKFLYFNDIWYDLPCEITDLWKFCVKSSVEEKSIILFDSVNILSNAYFKVGIMLDLLDIGTWYKILLIEKIIKPNVQSHHRFS